MIYILYSERTHNRTPEINYGGGITIPVRKGAFIFDEEKNDDIYYYKSEKTLYINAEEYSINTKLTFNNPVRAEIVFLKLKIEESKASSFDFFFPKSFKNLVDRYNELKEKYPEYVL